MILARGGGGAEKAEALTRRKVVGHAVGIVVARRPRGRLGIERPAAVIAVGTLGAQGRARVGRTGSQRTKGEQA